MLPDKIEFVEIDDINISHYESTVISDFVKSVSDVIFYAMKSIGFLPRYYFVT